MKRTMIYLVIATMLFSLLILPANAATKEEALVLANSYVPATATLLSSHESASIYMFIFRDDIAAQIYRIEFQKEPLLLKLLATQADIYQGAAEAVLSVAEIEEKVSAANPSAQNIMVSLDQKDSQYKYVVTFEIEDVFYRWVLNAETGTLLESVSNVGSSVVSDFNISDCFDDCNDDCESVVIGKGTAEGGGSACNDDCTTNCTDDCNGVCNDDCNNVEDDAKDAAEDAIDDAKDAAEDAIDDAKDAAEDAVDDAIDNAEDAADDAKDAKDAEEDKDED
jgi:hypothetical protein